MCSVLQVKVVDRHLSKVFRVKIICFITNPLPSLAIINILDNDVKTQQCSFIPSIKYSIL